MIKVKGIYEGTYVEMRKPHNLRVEQTAFHLLCATGQAQLAKRFGHPNIIYAYREEEEQCVTNEFSYYCLA